jgi:hypothetical protein
MGGKGQRLLRWLWWRGHELHFSKCAFTPSWVLSQWLSRQILGAPNVCGSSVRPRTLDALSPARPGSGLQVLLLPSNRAARDIGPEAFLSVICPANVHCGSFSTAARAAVHSRAAPSQAVVAAHWRGKFKLPRARTLPEAPPQLVVAAAWVPSDRSPPSRLPRDSGPRALLVLKSLTDSRGTHQE